MRRSARAARATTRQQTSGNDAEGEQHGVAGAHERENGDAEPDEREPAGRGCERGPRDEQCPARERGREHGLARELVEHQGVARVREQRGGDARSRRAARSSAPPPPSRRSSRRRGPPSAAPRAARRDVERGSRDERRDRRAEEHRPRQQDVVVEELDVRVAGTRRGRGPPSAARRSHGPRTRPAQSRRRRARRAASTRGSRATRGDARIGFLPRGHERGRRLASLSGWWAGATMYRD